jgi:neuron navigator 2
MSNGGAGSAGSGHHHHHLMYESDCNSDAEGSGVDVHLGYMSDGDVLRSSPGHHHHDSDLGGSGYVSEGGASNYAKRMQQRFHEGMMAVKECMEKSSANNKGGAILHDEDR